MEKLRNFLLKLNGVSKAYLIYVDWSLNLSQSGLPSNTSSIMGKPCKESNWEISLIYKKKLNCI